MDYFLSTFGRLLLYCVSWILYLSDILIIVFGGMVLGL